MYYICSYCHIIKRTIHTCIISSTVVLNKNADLITMARYEKCKTVVGIRVLIQQVSCFLDNFIDFIKTRVYDNFATKVQHFLHSSF